VIESSFSAQDYMAVTQLMSRYAWAFNTADFSALREVFSADGVLQGSSGQRHEGREAIIGYARTLAKSAAFRGRQHVIYNLLIDKANLSHCNARAYWSVVYWDGASNEKRLDSTGYSKDVFVRENNEWLIKERLIFHWKNNDCPWVGR
jgi:hypothetical protein